MSSRGLTPSSQSATLNTENKEAANPFILSSGVSEFIDHRIRGIIFDVIAIWSPYKKGHSKVKMMSRLTLVMMARIEMNRKIGAQIPIVVTLFQRYKMLNFTGLIILTHFFQLVVDKKCHIFSCLELFSFYIWYIFERQDEFQKDYSKMHKVVRVEMQTKIMLRNRIELQVRYSLKILWNIL